MGWRLKAVLSVYVQRLNYSTQSRQHGFGSSSSHRRSKVLEFTAVVFDKFPTQTLEWKEMREAYMCHYVVLNHTAFVLTFCHLYFPLWGLWKAVLLILPSLNHWRVIFIFQSLRATSKAWARNRSCAVSA